MGTSTLVVARTDAEAATYITSNIDTRDHPFILGATTPADATLNETLEAARGAGQPTHALEALEADWLANAKLDTFPNLVTKDLERLRLSVRHAQPLACGLDPPT